MIKHVRNAFLVAVIILGEAFTLSAQVVEVKGQRARNVTEGVVNFTGHTNRWAEIEARVNSLEALQSRMDLLECGLARLPVMECCRPVKSRWLVGYDHVVVKPYFTENIAFTDTFPTTNVITSFDWDAKYSPRLYVNYVAPGSGGLQVTYWHFDHETRLSITEPAANATFSADATGPTMAANSLNVQGTLNATHSLDVDVLDLELTRQAGFAWGWLKGSGGLRLAEMKQRAFWSETGGIETILVEHDFEGLGPTVRMEGGMTLFGSNLAAFASVRGSLLLGDRSLLVVDEANVGERVLPHEALLPILEAQFGLNWSTIVINKFLLSVRTALEAQAWFNGGSASAGDPNGGPPDRVDMGFLGLSVSTVLEW